MGPQIVSARPQSGPKGALRCCCCYTVSSHGPGDPRSSASGSTGSSRSSKKKPRPGLSCCWWRVSFACLRSRCSHKNMFASWGGFVRFARYASHARQEVSKRQEAGGELARALVAEARRDRARDLSAPFWRLGILHRSSQELLGALAQLQLQQQQQSSSTNPPTPHATQYCSSRLAAAAAAAPIRLNLCAENCGTLCVAIHIMWLAVRGEIRNKI